MANVTSFALILACVAATLAGQPRRETAYRVELQFRETLIPQVAEILPQMERPALDTLRFTASEMPRAYALVRRLYRYINPE